MRNLCYHIVVGLEGVIGFCVCFCDRCFDAGYYAAVIKIVINFLGSGRIVSQCMGEPSHCR